jgi:outer membrane protein assembly factor BamB
MVFIGSGYVPDASRDRGGAVAALDATTGDVLWRFGTDGPVLTSPVVDGSAVYVGDAAGTLYAMDAVTGAERWRLALDGQAGDAVLVNGVLYIATTTTGRDGPWPVVTAADGAVYVVSTPNSELPTTALYAVDVETGRPRWTFDAFATDRNAYYAIDATTGKSRWSFSFPGLLAGFAAVGGDTLFFGDASRGVLYAVDVASGQERWRHTTYGALWEGTMPVIANGAVYVGTKLGRFIAVDAATGTEHWSVQLDTDYLASSAVVVSDTIYIVSMRGAVFALATTDGSERWRYDVLEAAQVHASPAVIDGVVYVAVYGSGDSGVLFALGD